MKTKQRTILNTTLRILLVVAVLFNLLLVLFLASSLSPSAASVSEPNVPNDTYLSPNSIDDWFHTDALTQYHFFMGMERGNKLKDWKISTVNHYFPVIPLFGIFYYTVKNPGLSLLLFVLAQLSIILVLLAWLAKTILRTFWMEASIIGVLMVGLFTLYAIYSPDVFVCVNFLMPYHTGMFVCVLLSLIFSYSHMKKRSSWTLALLSVSIVLATISNPLYHVYFTFPMLLVLLLLSIGDMYRYLHEIATIVGSVVVGHLMMQILPDMAYKLHFNPARYDSWIMLKTTLVYIFDSSLFMKGIVITSAVSFVYSVIVAFKGIIRKISRVKETLDTYEIYNIYISIAIFGSFVAPVYAGNFVDLTCVRYLIYSMVLAVFNVGLILSYHFVARDGIVIRTIAISLTLFALSYAVVRGSAQNPLGAFQRVSQYNNKLALAVDSLSLKYPIKNGVSNFWDSKPITVFSKQKIKVAYTFSSLHLFHHSCCLTDFKYDTIGKPAYYNFIVLNKWDDTTSVCNRFGDSIVRVSEGGYNFYLVPEFTYDDNYDLVLTGRFDFD